MRRPRKKATHRGLCSICQFKAALTDDGLLYRHFSGYPGDDTRSWPNGVCRGWGEKPETVEEIP